MSSNSLRTTLGEICANQNGTIQTGPFGSQLHTSDYTELGIPVVMPTNITANGISQEGIARIGTKDVERLSQHKLKIGDIIFSRRGDVTKNALIREQESGWLCGTGCLKIRIGKEKIANAKYISYYLKTPEIKDWLIRHAVGATMPNLNTSILSAVPIALPALNIQQAISKFLSALDDRITLLRETNATLEAMAQTLFKSWFVDFDPVRAKMEGLQPEGMDEETAALFPDSFEESELRIVPNGWGVKPIGDLIETLGGGTPDTKNESFWSPQEFNWTSPKDLSGATASILLETEKKISAVGLKKISSGLLPKGTLLMSSRAPIGYLAIAEIPLAINQGYIAFPPGGKLSPLYMLFWCKANMDTIKGNANGSTFMEISKKAFRPILALQPPENILKIFDNLVGTLFEKLKINEEQVRDLSKLRDTLLPRLISGQLRLPEAEAIVAQST